MNSIQSNNHFVPNIFQQSKYHTIPDQSFLPSINNVSPSYINGFNNISPSYNNSINNISPSYNNSMNNISPSYNNFSNMMPNQQYPSYNYFPSW